MDGAFCARHVWLLMGEYRTRGTIGRYRVILVARWRMEDEELLPSYESWVWGISLWSRTTVWQLPRVSLFVCGRMQALALNGIRVNHEAAAVNVEMQRW